MVFLHLIIMKHDIYHKGSVATISNIDPKEQGLGKQELHETMNVIINMQWICVLSIV